jgi:hypothetical protein
MLPAGHKYRFEIVEQGGRSINNGGSGIEGEVGYDGRAATLRLYSLMRSGIERAEGFRHVYTLPEVWGLGTDYEKGGNWTTGTSFCSESESYTMTLSLNEKGSPPQSGPGPNDRVDVAVPILRNPDEYRWTGDGYPTLAPVLGVTDRSGEQNAQRDLFLAGIGLGAAVSIVTWGLQIMPWLRLPLIWSRHRI